MSRILLVLFGLFLSANVAANSNWVGALAPSFELKDQNGETKSLKDFKGQWVVLYFYPKDDTPGCTTEAKNFRDKYLEYKALNAEIVGISLDDVSSHKDFSNAYKLPFTILADERETFIIDPKGNIVYHYSDVDPDIHAEEVFEQLKKLQKELAS